MVIEENVHDCYGYLWVQARCIYQRVLGSRAQAPIAAGGILSEASLMSVVMTGIMNGLPECSDEERGSEVEVFIGAFFSRGGEERFRCVLNVLVTALAGAEANGYDRVG